MLQPFGEHIVLTQHDAEDYDNTAEDFESGILGDSMAAPQPHPLETDLEDAAEEEELVEKYNPFFEHNSEQIWKGCYLKDLFKALKIDSNIMQTFLGMLLSINSEWILLNPITST